MGRITSHMVLKAKSQLERILFFWYVRMLVVAITWIESE